MGLLIELLTDKDVATKNDAKSNGTPNQPMEHHEKNALGKISACEKCQSLFFWRSVYSPVEEPHCLDCDPPPSSSMVGTYLGVFQDQSGIVRRLQVDSQGRIILPRSLYAPPRVRDGWQMVAVDVSDLVVESEHEKTEDEEIVIENRARGFCFSEK